MKFGEFGPGGGWQAKATHRQMRLSWTLTTTGRSAGSAGGAAWESAIMTGGAAAAAAAGASLRHPETIASRRRAEWGGMTQDAADMQPVMTGSCTPLGSHDAGTVATDGDVTCRASWVRADGARRGAGGASMLICLLAGEE